MSAPRSAVAMTFIMCVAEPFSMSGFAAYTTLLPQFQREWRLSNSEAGLIGGIAFAGYMTAVPVLTALTDRIDSRRIYLAACLLSAAGALCFSLFAQGLWTALLCQFVIGAGLGGTYMPGMKTLTDHLAGAAQARATAFYAACFGVGSSVSIFACGYLGSAFGWKTAFMFGAVAPVVAALMVNMMMPRGRTRAAHAVFTFMCVHYALMLGDSAALTAGAIGSAHPDQRGAMMAVYSFIGFSAALIAPLMFGVVLDIAGGNRSTLAWGLAFASIGIFGALAPLARWWHGRRATG